MRAESVLTLIADAPAHGRIGASRRRREKSARHNLRTTATPARLTASPAWKRAANDWPREIKAAEQALARQKRSAKSAAAASAASGKSGRKGLPEETRAAIRESAGTLAETAVAFTVSEMTVRRIWKLAGRATV